MGRYTTEWLQHRVRQCWARRNHPDPVLRERNRAGVRFDVAELRRRKEKLAELLRLSY